MTRSTRLAVAVYRGLVRALPRAAREGFEDDMAETFAAAVTEPGSTAKRGRTIAASYADVVRCLGAEWREVLKSRAQSSMSRRSTKRRSQEKTMSSVVQDIRYALRQFASRPGFAVIVVLVLGPADATVTLERALYSSGRAVSLADAAALVVIAVGAVWVARALGERVPVLPEVLWLTSVALVAAQLPPVKRLSGGAMIGNYFVLLFLASNGAQSVIQNIVKVGPAVFYFACVTVAIHGIVIFGVGRLLKLDLGTLAIASQANVGGAASAMAMASARGYGDRLLPGVAVGLAGYAVGNYLGFAVATIMRSILA